MSTNVGGLRGSLFAREEWSDARDPNTDELALDGRMDLRSAARLGAGEVMSAPELVRLGVRLVRLFAAPNGGDGVLQAPLGDGLHIGAEGPCPAWRERAAPAVITAAAAVILLLFVLAVGRGLGEDERL
mmetsp:Transcript_42935/g.142945  ORF Transcript_42935/g.142945 Transcript_42935/m.142945 type:complete len:129 (-) Transcript_42935:1575-1961(-)